MDDAGGELAVTATVGDQARKINDDIAVIEARGQLGFLNGIGSAIVVVLLEIIDRGKVVTFGFRCMHCEGVGNMHWSFNVGGCIRCDHAAKSAAASPPGKLVLSRRP